jgi:uncharacterized membrane protein
MTSLYFELLLWSVAISSGLMAGTYFAFSGFIMRSFASLPFDHAVAAMNAINTTILKSVFMPLFFGSTVVSVLLIIAGLWHLGESGADRAVIAGAIYLVGMFVVTAYCNVPLNNALARADGRGEESRQMWDTYLSRWTRWNTVRALASTATFVVSIGLLTTH